MYPMEYLQLFCIEDVASFGRNRHHLLRGGFPRLSVYVKYPSDNVGYCTLHLSRGRRSPIK